MPLEQLLPLAGFVIAMVGTPGPNNLMLMTAGARFGFRRSVPHILGITFGCQTVLLAVALGLGRLLQAFPQALTILQVLGCMFLIYLAWLLLRPADASAAPEQQGRPLTFWEAALFQWINPKAWMMIITAIATYTNPQHFVTGAVVVAALFVILGIPLISAWSYAGTSLRDWLGQGQRLARFNMAMAALLVASLYPVLFSQ